MVPDSDGLRPTHESDEFFLCGEPPEEPLPPEEVPQLPSRPREGLVTYSAEMDLPLRQPAMRSGEVWHLCQEDGRTFEKARPRLWMHRL